MNMTVRKRGVLELNSAFEQNKLDLQSYHAMKYDNGVTTISEARIRQYGGVSVCRTREHADTHRTRVGYVSDTPRGVSLTI